MRFENACIPIGLAWSSPFVRWQGALAEVSSLDLAAQLTQVALSRADVPASVLSEIVLGQTVPQAGSFYGPTTLAARIGAPGVTGPLVSQACATGVASLQVAASSVEGDPAAVALLVTTDRTSNGPVLVYPSPSAPGGTPAVERWVLDSFARDPWGGTSMAETAEHVAAETGIAREELDELTLLRYEQYQDALADDRAFQRSYMLSVTLPSKRADPVVVDADQGVVATTAEGLAKLAPVTPEGVVTFGSQTHPADGAAGLVVASETRAREMSGGRGVARVLATGVARVEKARMPKAPVPAAQAALRHAGLELGQVNAIKTHNPFAVNDVYFANATGADLASMNAFGCSLIYGHPQAPTGTRAIAELIEILVRRGGGVGLFTGCAAGDSGAAVVLRVDG